MINVTALNKLLTDNADGKISQRWFITTPNGSLVAYTTPADIRQLRDQAALVLITWREQADALAASLSPDNGESDPAPGRPPLDPRLRALTVEFDNRNLLVRELQPKLLLVLEGGVPPGRTRELRITAEGADGERRVTGGNGYGAEQRLLETEAAGGSARRRRVSVLDVQRRKLDALAAIVRRDFEAAHFSMPSDADDRFF